MVDPITINVQHLAQDVRLPQEQVQTAVNLLDAGFSVAFIARYRKEVTQNLDEETLQLIKNELQTARVLCERKQTILKTIESAGKLTSELDKDIREAQSMKRLEDVYLPFRPKRNNPAVVARESGLEPLAIEILEGTLPVEKVDERAAEFFNLDKDVNSIADVLLGTGHIIADIFSCRAELVHKVRDQLMQYGTISAVKVESANAKKVETEKPADDAEEPAAAISESTDEIVDSGIVDDEHEIFTENVEAEEMQSESAEGLNEISESGELAENEAAGGSESGETDADETQEITELFEQLQEQKAEEGMPKVISQNTIRKKKRAEAKKKLNEIKQRQREHFERQFAEYFQFSARLRGLPTHRILALNRGERHKILQISVTINESKTLESVKEVCVPKEHPHADFLTGCLQDALHRTVMPMLIKEIRGDMTEYAEKNEIQIFSKNLRNLFLQRPLARHRVLAIEQSNKNGHVATALDEFGNLLGNETVFLIGNPERRKKAIQTLAGLIQQFNISCIAVGNGSRNIEEAVSAMIETHFADSSLSYVIVNRFGVNAYAATPASKAELPGEDVYVRAAVSLGRRLQDPMCELVKTDPANLGIGMFYREIRGNYLKQILVDAVDSCVNYAGIDLNSATPALLSHIAGLNPMTARRIYEFRREHGQFQCREDLKKVPGISETVYTHAAGFLRISGGTNPLDATNIHPENYELASQIIEKLGFSLEELRNPEKMKTASEKILNEKIGELAIKFSPELGASLSTVRDILNNLSHPGRDIRDNQPPLIFRREVLNFSNLTPGTPLSGTVMNVTDFGAFVDIGLHESGFIHISQMTSGYIRDAHEKVSVGDTVHVWVVESDSGKKRISLTLLPPGTAKQTPGNREGREHRPPREYQERSREQRETSPRPPRGSARDLGGGKRMDKDRQYAGGKSFDRAPKTFVSAPIKKEIKPITEKMKQGKEPMRSFSDLAQLLGQTKAEPEDRAGKKKKE